ncbi:MAG: YggS family pyridoxal phosphate-dependent enzyme, partial [Chloroflexi bacterium]|nr:YggS family pyridoxal phosphate-dependent enzyme [Chloroflexota bacterium]
MGIAENIRSLQDRIAAAAGRGGRRPEDVRLVVVTKTHPVEEILPVLEAGVRDLGENRVQEFLPKYDIIGLKANWHLIGSLQRNKVAKVVGKVALIHSVDSPELAGEIAKRAVERGIEQGVLLEVNVSGEASKHGFTGASLESGFASIWALEGIKVGGFMTMAP